MVGRRRALQTGRGGGVPPLLDLAHLARQTAGDATLALDLLRLFEAQSKEGLHDLKCDIPDSARVLELAHRLKGAARAVGARRVAVAAAAVEDAVARDAARDEGLEDHLSGLSVALALTLGSLAVVLRRGDLAGSTGLGLESFKTAG